MPIDLDELIGPYERWAFDVGAAHLAFDPEARGSPHVAALAELPPGVGPDGVAAAAGELRWPTLWRPAFGTAEPTFCPVVLTRRQRPASPDASRQAGGRKGPSYRVNGPLRPTTVNEGFRAAPIDAPEGRGASTEADVIVAVIDDGIPFAHRNLRDARGATRVDYCWLQGEDADPDPARHGVLFGREYLAHDIDAMIAASGDEDRLYGEAAREIVARGARRRGLATHGAHVLDTAAGHRHGAPPDPSRPTGPGGHLDRARVIAVQLPAPVTLDTAGLRKDAFILSAFHYVFERADRIARRAGRPLPLVINFSYGFTGGPHGGRDRLERALRALVRRREALEAPTYLVMPAGNSFLSALHGEITAERLRPAADGTPDAFTIPWRIQPCDRTPNYLEIWLPRGARPDKIRLTVRDPDGTSLCEMKVGDRPGPIAHEGFRGANGEALGQVSLERVAVGPTRSLWRFVVAVAPTEPLDPGLPAARAGLWRVELRPLGPATSIGPVSCRIQRDIDPFGYAYGARQSYFDDPLDRPFDATGRRAVGENPDEAFVRRLGTLNGLATHDAATVVGGFVEGSRKPAAYASAGGRERGAGGARVHLSAPTEASPALGGMRAAGARSGASMRLSGTSTAAPQVARALAVAVLNGAGPGAVGDLLRDRLSSVNAKGSAGIDLRARLGDALLEPSRPLPARA